MAVREAYEFSQIPPKTHTTDILLVRYGLRTLASWMKSHDGPDISEWEPRDIERFCIRGKMASWRWAVEEEMPLEKSRDFPIPKNSYPLFDYGTNGPTGHFKHFADLVWNGKVEWVKQCRGQDHVQNHFLTRCLWDVTNRTQYCDERTLYNMLCGPGSCGKTFAASLRLLLLFYAFPKNFMGKVCSSSKGAAESRVWAEVMEWHEASVYHGLWCMGGEFKQWQGAQQRLLFVEGPPGSAPKDQKKDVRKGIELVALPRSAIGKGAVRQLKGMRQDVKLWVVDEATDVDPSAFDAEIAGNWLEAPFLSQIIYLANPNHDSSAFVEHYMPAEGEFYDVDSPGWVTKHHGYVTNLNGLDTPNGHFRTRGDTKRRADSPPCPFHYITNLTGLDRLERRAGGRDTAAFMSQAVGFLPSADVADSILTLPMMQAAGMDQMPEWVGEGYYPLLGNDPAFGGDDFIIAPGEIGYGWVYVNGQRVRRVILNVLPLKKVPIQLQSVGRVTPEELAARWVATQAKSQGIGHLSAISSDATGTSKGFVHNFENIAKNEFGMDGTMMHRVGWKERCSERPEGPDDPTARKSVDAYKDATSELVMAARQWRNYIRGFTNEDLVDQFGKRKFHIGPANKFVVQSKDEFKNGVASKGWAPYGFSPDEMDAVCVLIDLARTCGLGTDTLSHPSEVSGGGRLQVRRQRRYGGAAAQTEGWTSLKAG